MATLTKFTQRPLKANFGMEITGIDVAHADPETLDRVLAARPRPGDGCRSAGWVCAEGCACIVHDLERVPNDACFGSRACRLIPLPAGQLHRHCDRCGIGQPVTDDDARRTSGPGMPIFFECRVVQHQREQTSGVTMAAVGWFCARCERLARPR